MKIYDSVCELIGNTPLVRVKYNVGSLLAKLEYFNPLGSVKDRVGFNMIEKALQRGDITPSSVIIEPTSGNTGIALAFTCAQKGMKCILTMPESMSLERRKMLSALGAQIVLTPAELGMQGAVDKANELHASIPGSFIPDQFSNPDNPDSHSSTAFEIVRDTDAKVDYFIACIGTGGTVSGVGKALKKAVPSVKIVGVESAESPLISKGISGPHKIQGIGANFIPSTFDPNVCDELVTVSSDDAYLACRTLAKEQGLFLGISSGAAICAAAKIAKKHPDATIVALCPDGGSRYLSSDLFD